MARKAAARKPKKGRTPSADNVARERMLEYVDERGVSERDAEAAGFEPLDASAAFEVASKYALGRTAFRIPFRNLDDETIESERLRFTGEPTGLGKHAAKPLKFWQAQDTEVTAYLAPAKCVGRSWREIAKDTTADLVITEGEVKALAACLRGITTIGVTGVDNFHVGGDKDALVPGLAAIEWRGRFVAIAYDSDAAQNANVVRAEGELQEALERRGATVHVVRLPPAPDGQKQGLDDYLLANGPDAFRKLLATAERLPHGLDSCTDLFKEYPPVQFAIYPYLPKGEFVEIHGPHGLHKSRLMLYAALSVATGEPWCVEAPTKKQGRAIFISLEDGSATLARRLRCWLRGPAKFDGNYRKRDAAKVEESVRTNFRFLGREKATSLVLTKPADYGHRTLPSLSVVDWLVKHCIGADLVVLETAARLNSCGEDNDTLAVFASALERVATKTGACVVLVRHVSKEVARSGQVDSLGGRGGGALADAARSVLSVAREGEDQMDALAPVKLVHTKSTHTAPGPTLMWRPEPRDADADVYLRGMPPEERENATDHGLLRTITNAGPAGLTRREITRSYSSDRKRCAETDAALARLVETDRVREVFPDSKRGPKAPKYVAAVHADATPANAEAEVVSLAAERKPRARLGQRSARGSKPAKGVA